MNGDTKSKEKFVQSQSNYDIKALTVQEKAKCQNGASKICSSRFGITFSSLYDRARRALEDSIWNYHTYLISHSLHCSWILYNSDAISFLLRLF